MPKFVYALLIDGDQREHALYDAVDGDWLEQRLAEPGGLQRIISAWPNLVEQAPVFAVEFNARTNPRAREAMRGSRTLRAPRWVVIELIDDPAGEAEVYASSIGPARRARVRIKPISQLIRLILIKATDLARYDRTGEVTNALPAATVHHVVVLDVGQGFASALVDKSGGIIGYVDLGAGVLADAKTWPSAMTGICLSQSPIVVLSHWHYDHFEAANVYPSARSLTWIAPLQSIGPGPQSAMASAIASTGKLLVWRGSTASKGALTLECCRGPVKDFNRTGIAVWVAAPSKTENPILLPGDAGYKDIPTSPHLSRVTSIAASHHVGKAPGKPPRDPGLPVSRIAMSYGHANSYGHPLAASTSKLIRATWSIGPAPSVGLPSAAIDERRTEVRRGAGVITLGGAGLGHIGLSWPSSGAYSRYCTCGCSLDPTQ